MTDEIRPQSRSRLEIDWVKTVAGALAAVSSAVLLSRVGAAGTILGAALGSVVVTVAGAFYSQGLERSRARLAEAHASAAQRVGAAQAEVRRARRRQVEVGARDPAARSDLRHAEEHLHEARQDLDRSAGELPGEDGPTPAATGAWSDRLAGLPWRRIAITAAALFVGVVVAITAFELLAGRSVSSYTGGTDRTGGTSITQLGSGDKGSTDTPTPTPSDAATPSEQPSEEPSQVPTDTASESPSTGASGAPEPTPTADVPTAPATPSASDQATPPPADPTPSAAAGSALP